MMPPPPVDGSRAPGPARRGNGQPKTILPPRPEHIDRTLAPPPAVPMVTRDQHGRFLHGVSGNPRGRPAVLAVVRKLARTYTEESIENLVEIMRDKMQHGQTRVAAIRELLNRAYGTPVVHVETGAAGAFEDMDDNDLASYIKAKALKITQEGFDDDGKD